MLSNSYALRRIAQIDARLEELSSILATLPEGRLHISTCRGVSRYYQIIGKIGDPNYSRNYLNSNKHDISVGLAKKELYTDEIRELNLERKSIELLLSVQNKKSRNFISDFRRERIQRLISEDKSDNSFYKDYTSSAPNQEMRKIRAIDGTMVRSKSEAEIISLLSKYNLPYKYECDLIHQGRVIGCPDFTIMHPFTHEILIWEHFGLLDDIYYVRKNIYKVQKYIEIGYCPMINFIITGETAANPFDITLADSLIHQFFLQ